MHVFTFGPVLWPLQHPRGRPPHHQLWVFGMVDTSQVPGLGYMEVVPSQDANTLLPIIRAHTAPALRPVARLQHGQLTPRCDYSWWSKSLATLRGPCNWGAHPDSRKLLESCKNETEQNERL